MGTPTTIAVVHSVGFEFRRVADVLSTELAGQLAASDFLLFSFALQIFWSFRHSCIISLAHHRKTSSPH